MGQYQRAEGPLELEGTTVSSKNGMKDAAGEEVTGMVDGVEDPAWVNERGRR